MTRVDRAGRRRRLRCRCLDTPTRRSPASRCRFPRLHAATEPRLRPRLTGAAPPRSFRLKCKNPIYCKDATGSECHSSSVRRFSRLSADSGSCGPPLPSRKEPKRGAAYENGRRIGGKHGISPGGTLLGRAGPGAHGCAEALPAGRGAR